MGIFSPKECFEELNEKRMQYEMQIKDEKYFGFGIAAEDKKDYKR